MLGDYGVDLNRVGKDQRDLLLLFDKKGQLFCAELVGVDCLEGCRSLGWLLDLCDRGSNLLHSDRVVLGVEWYVGRLCLDGQAVLNERLDVRH